jgi:methylenetetrahydrofolate dehydrogenase (NADP+) / methenyltetrahydrofolate cyclohydrolase
MMTTGEFPATITATMAVILDGKALAQRVRAKVKERVASLPKPPVLAVLLVGEDPASHTYVRLKETACKEAGIVFERYEYPADVSEATLLERIAALNARPEVTGILIQIPLPSQDADKLVAAIDPKKDVDGFHRTNVEALKAGKPAMAPAVALGIMKLLEATQQRVADRSAVVVSSEVFAEPLVALLDERGMKTSVVSPDDAALAEKAKAADALILAAGRPNLITAEAVKPGAIVIDVGTTKVEGALTGDVDRASVEPVAGFLTPVPGGVGPMTVAMLLANVAAAAMRR